MTTVSKSGPETINLELTLRCNLKCRMCDHGDKSFRLPAITDMSLTTVAQVIPLMHDAKIIWLSGTGEPLLHNDLVAIVSKIHTSNPTAIIAFTTNLILMSRNKLELLIRAGLTRIQVSIDGKTELGHNFSPSPQGIAEYQKKLWINLRELYEVKKELQAHNPELQFCFVAMKSNISQLKSIIEQGITVGLSSIVVQPIQCRNDTMKNEDLFENKLYALPFLAEAKDFAKKNNIEFICRFMDDEITFTRKKCYFPWTFFHVTVHGQVAMCCEGISAEMDVHTISADKIWTSPAYHKLREEHRTGLLRRKCWDCSLMSPTTQNWDVLSKGLNETTTEALVEEIAVFRKYIAAVHSREEKLIQEIIQYRIEKKQTPRLIKTLLKKTFITLNVFFSKWYT